ncbi:hypothetical protein [Lutispora sp.]|nr:hypothetical protein [Lutispora sp.]MEA4960426.1 hypothetical protein [Lutispora sp.]
MMKKLILILLVVSIIGLTSLYCLAEEEGNIPFGIGTEESMF